MTRVVRYTPGDAWGVVSGPGTVLIRADAEVALDLWELLDAGGWTDESVLDHLTSGGLASVPPFCALLVRGEVATVVSRGSCSVTVHGERGPSTVDGRMVSTWIERSIAWGEGAGAELHLLGSADEDSSSTALVVASGVVPAARVTVGAVRHDVAAPPADQHLADPQVDEAPALDGAPPVETPVTEDSAEPSSADPAHQEPASDDLQIVSDRPVVEALAEPITVASTVADPNATLGDVDVSRYGAMFGATVPRRLEDAAVREPTVPSQKPDLPAPPTDESPVVGDHDGHTMTAAELALLRAGRSGGDPAPLWPTSSAQTRPEAPVVTLVLSTGRTVTLDRPAVLGRSPRVHGSTSADMQQAVVIDNPYVSGTHLVAAVEDGVVIVTDLSTNGTVVRRPGEAPQRLDKGRETVVSAGTVLSLSDDITATVEIGGLARG